MSVYVPERFSRRQLEHLATLPIWADDRTKITWYERHDIQELEIIIAHPEHPPHRLNRSTKTWEEIKYEPRDAA